MKIWKNSKFRILLPAVGAVALLGMGGVAMADAEARGARGKRGGLCAKLECTEAQQKEVRAVMSELRADSKGDRAALQRLNKQLAAEFAKAQPDEAAMRGTQAKISNHRQQMQERRLDAMLEVHSLLNAEQRATMAKAMERRGLRGMKRGGKGKGEGKGKRGERTREVAG